LSEVSHLGLELQVFNVQPAARDQVFDLIAASKDAERRLAFARGLISPTYTGLAYVALIGALGIVELSGTANLTSLGAVMLIMLRSLSYGQGLQAASAAIAATSPFLLTLHEELARYQAARRHDGGRPVGTVGTLSLREVSFSYVPGVPVLHDLTFDIAPREIVGIVGPSGGGKSTLVQLLLGLREPDAGTIEADGRPVSDLSRAEWARRVTFVPQDPNLFSGSIADNIRFLRDGVDLTDIERAAKLAHLHEDVVGSAEGYDRLVGEGGGRLSGGQRQRLCIARALVEQPDVLILDEPTSSLDVQSEHLIRQTLVDLREHMTIIVIAHRLSTLDICDRLMVIQDGELKAFDTPARLSEGNAFYHQALVLSGMK
jgi:ATP-binding cassette subfamily B protein